MPIFLSLLKFWREGLIAALAIGLFFSIKHRPAAVETIVDRIVYKDRVVEVVKEVAVDRVRTITVSKPDGTKITQEEHTVTKQDTHVAEHEVTKQQVHTESAADPYRYSATALVNRDWKHPAFDVGARLGNLPLQGVLGYDFSSRTAHLGLRVDF